MSRQIVSGHRFGRWVILKEAPRRGNHRYAECKCDCGSVCEVNIDSLYKGTSTSCGCYSVELCKRHGHATEGKQSPTYVSWCSLIQRCTNPKSPYWADYGGRGITVCDRWREDFVNFLADVGERPSLKHSIDRFPDKNGNYEPGNVRWATDHEQKRNTRYTRNITVDGVTHCLADWARTLGCRPNAIRSLTIRGASWEQAVAELIRRRDLIDELNARSPRRED